MTTPHNISDIVERREEEFKKHLGWMGSSGTFTGFRDEEIQKFCRQTLISILENEVEIEKANKMTRIEWAGATDEEKNQLLALFDAHNKAKQDTIDRLQGEVEKLKANQ